MKFEKNRLKDLESYNVLDTDPEKELDEIAEIASLICETPISLITMIDKERQWFKAKKGLEVSQTSLEGSFCQHTLNKPKEILVINDALNDERFEYSPLVTGDPNIRFYAGAPLETPNGNVLGTLCIIDNKPRTISKNQEKALKLLAKKAIDYLNTRKKLLEQSQAIEYNAEHLIKLTENIPGGIFQLRMNAEGDLQNEFISKGIMKLYPTFDWAEWKKDAKIGYDLIHTEDLPSVMDSLEESYKNLTIWYKEYRVLTGDVYKWQMVKAKPEKLEDGSVVWYGSFQDITGQIEYEKDMEQIAFDISHVLRKPVTTLLGLTTMLKTEENLTENSINEYSKNIQIVADELEKFTRELNDVYKEKKEKSAGLKNI